MNEAQRLLSFLNVEDSQMHEFDLGPNFGTVKLELRDEPNRRKEALERYEDKMLDEMDDEDKMLGNIPPEEYTQEDNEKYQQLIKKRRRFIQVMRDAKLRNYDDPRLPLFSLPQDAQATIAQFIPRGHAPQSIIDRLREL